MSAFVSPSTMRLGLLFFRQSPYANLQLTNDIPLVEMKAIQIVERPLGISHLLVHDIRRPLCARCIAESNLADGTVATKYLVQIGTRGVVVEVLDKEDATVLTRSTNCRMTSHAVSSSTPLVASLSL